MKCDASLAYGGGIYDPAQKLTPTERGAWIGKILATYIGTGKAVPTGTDYSRWILFPFTDGSCPTLAGVIKTADQFDQFLAGFKTAIAKTFVPDGSSVTVEDWFVYGAWGTPPWFIKTPSACTKNSDCADAAPQCRAGTCVPCTSDAGCTGHANPHCAADGTCQPSGCTRNGDCPAAAPQCRAGKCVPCTSNAGCAGRGTTSQCHEGRCRSPWTTGWIVGVAILATVTVGLFVAAAWGTAAAHRHRRTNAERWRVSIGLMVTGLVLPPLWIGPIVEGARAVEGAVGRAQF